MSHVIETCAEVIREVGWLQRHERDAIDAIATQLEGIADRLRSIAWRLRHLYS